MNEWSDIPTVSILDTDVAALKMDALLDLCQNVIHTKKHLLLGVVNVAKLVNARKNPELRKSLNEANIILADGAPVVWLSRLIRQPLPERVPGIDIMTKLLERASVKKYGVYFLGAKQDVLQRVVDHVRQHDPGVRVAGYHDGYFNEDQEKEIAQEIRDSGAQILFVAVPTPKKENFLRRWQEVMQVNVCHGVGGSFDVVAGVVKRAPRWMQKCGLEWLYRTMQEPRRMWKRYLVTNCAFFVLSFRAVATAWFCQKPRKTAEKRQKTSNI